MTTSNGKTNTRTYVPNTVTAQSSEYSKSCAYRLPCGLCRLTNSTCPLVSSQPSYISRDDTVNIGVHNLTITCSSGVNDHVEGTD